MAYSTKMMLWTWEAFSSMMKLKETYSMTPFEEKMLRITVTDLCWHGSKVVNELNAMLLILIDSV